MTENELKEIEARLPRGVDRIGAHLDASHLAAEVRNAWTEGVELRRGLTDVRNAGARALEEREASDATTERYKVERDELSERCTLFRKGLTELLNGLQGDPPTEATLADVVTKARALLDAPS
jgi:hypothetical protein